jgi:glycosyltransferase involved in cell wall biosynthesis
MRIGIDARKISDFGIGTYIRGLLGGLAQIRGAEEYVVFGPMAAAEHIPGGFEHHVVDAPHYSARELVVIGRAARDAALDLFHAPHYVVPFTRCRTVVTVHDLIHLRVRHRNPAAPLYARAMIRRAVRKAACVFVVSEAVGAEIASRYAGARVVVTPNGVDERFRFEEPERQTQRYFLYAGNDKPHKNVERLVEAFGILRRERPDLTLILAGGAFEKYHDADGVIAAGFVSGDELVSLYRHSLALVQPSIEEGFGLPALEAMAAGTAVITSNNAALVEVTGEAAIHAFATSVLSLHDAMRRVADDDALRVDLARRGIERAREFTWKRCASITRDAYLRALES